MLCAVSSLARATDGASGDAPLAADSYSGDVGVYTDYIARGLSYTSEKTSLQARFEYDWTRGPYLGVAINHRTRWNGAQSVEIDPYAGYLVHIGEVSLEVGEFAWIYPHSQFPVTHTMFNTVEGYVGAGYKAVAARFWYELTDYFGLDDGSARANYGLPPNDSSRGSHYLEANLTLPAPHGFTVLAHAGHQWIRHYGQLDYTDAMIGMQKDLGRGFVAGASRTETTADGRYYTDGRGINLARGKWLLYFKWTFP